MHASQTPAGGAVTPDSIARLIDHATLQPAYSDAQILEDLASIKYYPLASVCIKPYAVPVAVAELAGTTIGVGTVIGFPHGAERPEVKAREAEAAFAQGAREADMVINIGKALSEDWSYLRDDIGAVLGVVRAHGGVLKVIFETGLLPHNHIKIKLCELCSDLRVDFVKTSTGYGYIKGESGGFVSTGATQADLRLMRAHSAPEVGVKASGGVRSLDDVLRAIEIGVTRIGTTSTHAILSQARERFGDATGEVLTSQADY